MDTHIIARQPFLCVSGAASIVSRSNAAMLTAQACAAVTSCMPQQAVHKATLPVVAAAAVFCKVPALSCG
jgi:hypothetical protein